MTIAASPGRPAREAALALRFGPASIKFPERGMPLADLKMAALRLLPEAVDLHLVDVREVDAPKGIEPIHWLLLTSHVIEVFGQARRRLCPIGEMTLSGKYFLLNFFNHRSV